MSIESDPLDELAGLVADTWQLADAWRSVGFRDVPPGPPTGWTPPASTLTPSLPAPPAPPPRPPAERTPFRPLPVTPSLPAKPSTAPILAPPPKPAPQPLSSAWDSYGQDRGAVQALAALRGRLGECTRCGLHRGRNSIVWGRGNPDSGVLIVGEAPGAEEDVQGMPFMGAAGQMLDRMIEKVLMRGREDVYIINVMKCRLPENRDPMPEEIASCREFLVGQVSAVKPRAILTLGRLATQVILGTREDIRSLRGKWRSYEGIPVMPTYHPAHLLRNPDDKRLTMADLVAFKGRLEETDPSR